MAICNPTHSQNIWEHKEPVTHGFTSRPTALPCFGRRPWATTRPSPTLQRRVCPSTSVAEEKHKPLRKAPPPAFSLAVKNSTLHPAGKPSTSVILHSSFYSASLSQLVTKSHCCTCCVYVRPPRHLSPSVSSGQIHCLYRFTLHTITAMTPLPRHSLTHKAVIVPPLADVTTSVGDSMSFRTWPNLSSSRLPYRCAILAPPDSSFQTTKCSFHLHTCLFLPGCPASFCYSFEVCLFL